MKITAVGGQSTTLSLVTSAEHLVHPFVIAFTEIDVVPLLQFLYPTSPFEFQEVLLKLSSPPKKKIMLRCKHLVELFEEES
jgi:hypothetical protein